MIKLKTILLNMSQEELLNFIWLYDLYIGNLEKINSEENEDMYPVRMEEFHRTVYPQMVSK